jgi:hypothetical protein
MLNIYFIGGCFSAIKSCFNLPPVKLFLFFMSNLALKTSDVVSDIITALDFFSRKVFNKTLSDFKTILVLFILFDLHTNILQEDFLKGGFQLCSSIYELGGWSTCAQRIIKIGFKFLLTVHIEITILGSK